jgi:hypothetical protein
VLEETLYCKTLWKSIAVRCANEIGVQNIKVDMNMDSGDARGPKLRNSAG